MYRILVDRLQPGDILLSSENSLVSKTIRKSTRSRHSHSMLYASYACYIHADRDGVHSGNPFRLRFGQKEDFLVLRVKDVQKAAKACSFARDQIGMEYSVKEAIKSKLPPRIKSVKNRQFCSRLIAQSYAFSGLDIVSNPNYCTPQELKESLAVHVVDNCLTDANDRETQAAEDLNFHDRVAKHENVFFKSVRNLTESDIQTLNQLLNFLLCNPRFDSELTKIFISSGYESLYDGMYDGHEFLLNGHAFLELPISVEDKQMMASTHLDSALSKRQRYEHNIELFESLISETGLEFAKVSLNMFKRLHKLESKAAEAAHYVIGQIGYKMILPRHPEEIGRGKHFLPNIGPRPWVLGEK